jgi:hypothetical protein
VTAWPEAYAARRIAHGLPRAPRDGRPPRSFAYFDVLVGAIARSAIRRMVRLDPQQHRQRRLVDALEELAATCAELAFEAILSSPPACGRRGLGSDVTGRPFFEAFGDLCRSARVEYSGTSAGCVGVRAGIPRCAEARLIPLARTKRNWKHRRDAHEPSS